MKALLAFSILIPMFGGFFFTKAKGSNPRPDGPASSYEYQYSGTMMYPLTYYDVKRDETGAVRIAYLEEDWDTRDRKGPDVMMSSSFRHRTTSSSRSTPLSRNTSSTG